MNGRILLCDDDRAMCRMLERGLGAAGHSVSWHTSADEAMSSFSAGDYDVVVTDVRMRGTSGLELCGRIQETCPEVPVIVITAFGSMETAIDALRSGAFDFVVKPFELDVIRLAVQRAISHRRLRQRVGRLEQALRDTERCGALLGRSPGMRTVFELVERVADTSSAVLVTGESGTGKELVARAIHDKSRRRGGPFVAVNCAAMPAPLLESELFGHVKGAFTDAKAERQGLVHAAEGGTLFLDEIGEMPLELQPKLLRALQERAARPVGAEKERPFDARIVTASNRDLEGAVEEGRLRADLYYRIHVIEIHVPPLRARGNDVLLLAEHFVQHYATVTGKPVKGISPAAAERLLAYSWPGNVRQLQNSIERAVTLTRFEEIAVEDLPERLRQHRRQEPIVPGDATEFVPMEEVERRYLLRVFEATGGNKSASAKILGLNRKTLYRKLVRYGVIPGDLPEEPKSEP